VKEKTIRRTDWGISEVERKKNSPLASSCVNIKQGKLIAMPGIKCGNAY
jgi:hypothetical protein